SIYLVLSTRSTPSSTLFPYTTLFRSPAHGAGSLCGNAIRDVKESTIGYERAHNFGFQIKDEQEFVKILLQDQPYIPKYFPYNVRSEEHTSELQSRENLVCRLLLEKKK